MLKCRQFVEMVNGSDLDVKNEISLIRVIKTHFLFIFVDILTNFCHTIDKASFSIGRERSEFQ